MFRKYSAPNILFVILLFSTLSMLSLVLARPHGQHGGTVKKAGNYFIEMKIEEKTLTAYLLTNKQKAVDPKDLFGDARFLFPDSTEITIPLKPTKEDFFTCETPEKFYECRITFNYLGKLLSAKFANPVQLVSKK